MTSRDTIRDLQARMSEDIVGQEHILERIVIGLLANGNLLVEGLPGLAKTRAIKSLGKHLEADFSRIQFTPDLLPSDVTGTEIYHQVEGKSEFRFDPGPIFANLVLADEINRAPAKVQAALLEAMEERQVTVAGTTHALPPLFLVMATLDHGAYRNRFPARAKGARDRSAERYLVRLSEILTIQDHILAEAEQANLPIIDNVQFDDAVLSVTRSVISTLKKSMPLTISEDVS